MLYSLVIQLFPEDDIVLPATLGRHAHAALMGMLRRVDGELGLRTHDAQGEKPFTVSPLQGRFERGEQGQVKLAAGGEYWLRWTFLTDELYQAVSRFFLEAASPTVQLGEGRFVVARVTATGDAFEGVKPEERMGEERMGEKEISPTRPYAHTPTRPVIPFTRSPLQPWSGHATFEQLWEAAQARERVSMRFFSPTCFRLTAPAGGARSLTEPSLRHCVQSWLNRWNRFAPSHLFLNPERLLDFVEAHGQLRRADILTRALDFGTYQRSGFVGMAEWALRCERRAAFDRLRAEHVLREIDALAEFAFYCGTGTKTTMGMGQTRRVDGLQRKDAKAQRAQM